MGAVADAAANEWNLSPAYFKAVMQTESGGQANGPDSSAGATGPLQVMPGTANDMGVTDPRDPVQNTYAGAKYLSGLLDKYNSPELALAAYNAGPGRVDAYLAGQADLPDETKAYVPKVLSAYRQITGGSTPGAGAPTAAAPPYQVASADTGTASDAMPSPSAPPSAAASPTASAPSDPFSKMMQVATKAAPAAAPPASASGAPEASGQPSSAAGDPFSQMIASAHQAQLPPSTSTGFWSGLRSGATTAAEGIANAVDRGAAYVDKNVPALGALDQAALPAIGLQQPADTSAQLTSDMAARDKADAGNVGYQVGKIGGDIALTLPAAEFGAGALGAGLGLGADAVGAGSVAGRVLQSGANLATGTGTAGVGKGLSFLTSNAGKGVIANELAGNPDTPGSNATSGALYGVLGGAGAAVATPMAKGLTMLLGSAGKGLLDSLAPASADVGSSSAQAASRDASSAAAAPAPAALTADTTVPARTPIGVLSDSTPTASAGDAGATTAGTTTAPDTSAPAVPANLLMGSPRSAPANPLAPGVPGDAASSAATPGSSYVPLSDIVPTQAVPTSIKPQGLVLTQQQASDAADRIMQQFASGGPVDLPTSVLPGSAFDASEATGNTGLAALKSFVINNNPSAGNLFAGIKDTNNAARLQVLSGIMGTPDDVASAEAARDALTAQRREAAFANAQPVDVSPIANAMQAAIDEKAGYPSVQKPLQDIKDTLDSVTQTDPQTGATTADPRALWNVRQEINAMISPLAAGTAKDGRQAASQLISLKPVLDNEIEKGAPGFGDFIDQYSKLQAPIDGMNWLQKQGITITDGQGNITLAKIDGTIKALQKQQVAPGAREADGVTPGQYQALLDLRENLRQAGAAVYRGKLPGSDTARNLGSNALVNALTTGGHGLLGQTVNSLAPVSGEALYGPLGAAAGLGLSMARAGAGAAVSRGSGMIMDQLANKLTNPIAYRKAVNALVAPNP